MQVISGALNTAINNDVQRVKPRLKAIWADNRYMENLTVSTNSEEGTFFNAVQAGNGWLGQTFRWAVTDAKDENGNVITANGSYVALPKDDESLYEFGWWSDSTSNGSGNFATSPFVQLEFDQRLMNKVRLYPPENYGRPKSVQVHYKNIGGAWVSLGTFQIPKTAEYYEYDHGSNLDIRGIRATVHSTWNATDKARLHEIEVIFEEDISDYVISSSESRTRDLYEDTVPIGSAGANSFSVTLDNTSRYFNPNGASAVAEYVRKDVKFIYGLGWETTTDVFEYVDFGEFYADDWQVESGSMVATVQCRDFSKFLQDAVESDGVLYENTSVGEAVANLAKRANVPESKIRSIMPLNRQIILDGAVGYWRLGEDNNSINAGWRGKWFAKELYNYLRVDENSSRAADTIHTTLDLTDYNPASDTDYYNASIEAYVIPSYSQLYTFYFLSTDGIRVWVNGELMLDRWHLNDGTEQTFQMNVVANQPYHFKIHHFHETGTQRLRARWSSSSQALQVIPNSAVNENVAVDIAGARHGKYPASGVTYDFEGLIPSSNDMSKKVNNTSIVAPHNSALNLNGAFTIEGVVKLDTFINTNPGIIKKGQSGRSGAPAGYSIDYNSNGAVSFNRDGFTLTGSNGSIVDTAATHICVTYDGSIVKLWINGILDAQAARSFGNLSSTSTLTLGTGTQNGHHIIDEMAVYNRALKDYEVEQHACASKVDIMEEFKYIYVIDKTIWDAISEFALADLGIFFFDEFGIFNYQHGSRLFENCFPQHANIQTDLDQAVNIIEGSQPIELQANKVTVKVNPISVLNTGFQGIWRADDGASVVVSQLLGTISAGETGTIFSSNTDEPAWFDSGYLKIDDEIIKYGRRDRAHFYDLTRGMFETTPAGHSAGAAIRETRLYDIDYANAPATNIQQPFIIAGDAPAGWPLLNAAKFEGKVTVDSFKHTAYRAEILVSADEITANGGPNTVGEIILLEGTNPVTEKNYYFALSGIPITEEAGTQEIKEESADIRNNIRKWGRKQIDIDSKFIQTVSYAKKIANLLISHFSNPVPFLSVDIMGMPHLQLGDRIRITTFDQLNITNKEYWIIEISTNFDGGVSQNLRIREVS